MKSDILKKENIGDIIIGELSCLDVDIPNKGFLAGGAVANLLMRFVWEDDSYPINDLDVFIERDRDFMDFRATPIRSNSLIVEGDGYMVTKLSYDHGSNYQILDVERDGLLNTIKISKVSNDSNRKDYQYILNGFDFNCCQVGVDLSTNKIFYTEGFEKFLNYRQLEVTAVYTPAHTAIRLFKKLDELKCYCNIDECMELLSQPLIKQNMMHLRSNQFGIYFSTKYKEMYMKYYSKIKEYFKMVKFFDHKKSIFMERIKFESTIPNGHGLSWLDVNSSIPKEQLEKWAKYNDIMWTLEPKKYDKPNETITEILVGLDYNPLTFMNAYTIVSNRMTKKLKEKAEKVVMNKFWLCKMVALVNNKFYDCDFDVKHIEYIESFTDKERWALSYIVREKLNIQESYEFISDVKKVLNKEGDWVTEMIIRFLESKNKVVKATYQNLIEGIEKEKLKYASDLIEPINIEDFKLPKGVTIKELSSELNLKWAGRKLNNCMNNPSQSYAEKIKRGKCKLFVIMTENNMSGMELELIENTTYRIVQLLSYCNKVTSEFHTTVANIFLNYLNMKHLKEIYESKMKSYDSIDILNRGLLTNIKDEKTDNNLTGGHFPDLVPVIRELNVEYGNPDPEVERRLYNYIVDINRNRVLPEVEYNEPGEFIDPADDGPDMDIFFR